MDTFIEVAKIYGPQAAVIGFFIWWAYQREKSLVAALEKATSNYENDSRETRSALIELVKANNEAILLLRHSVDRLDETLSDRPCISKHK